MAELDNYIDKAISESIDLMSTNEWSWPPNWDSDKRHVFIDKLMQFAESREYYEQCAILRDVKKTIK
jgi:serine kinase of HPr protein (carbohydrate metabolism regulator)